MQIRKLTSVVLVLSLVMGVTGCFGKKKITTERFIEVVEGYDADEVKFSKINKSDADDIETGIYSQFSGEDFEDDDSYQDFVDEYDVPFEAEDIISGALYYRIVGANDIVDVDDVQDLAGLEVDALCAAQLTLSEDKSEDIFEFYADILDTIDINIDDLSDEEFFVDKSTGTLRLNIDIKDLADRVPDLNMIQVLLSFLDQEASDIINELVDNASGNVCLLAYVDGDTIVIAFAVGYGNAPELIDTFCSDLGLSTPTEVEANEDFADSLMDYVDTKLMDELGPILSWY